MLKVILDSLGMHPVKEQNGILQYFSPFRLDETTPSFYIYPHSQRGGYEYYKDFGNGEKGQNYFSFLMTYYGISFNEAVKKWHEINKTGKTEPVSMPKNVQLDKVAIKPIEKPTIVNIEPLHTDYLRQYLYSRGITNTDAIAMVKEVTYTHKSKEYKSIGIKNQGGGINHRNKYVKGVIGKTGISIFEPTAPMKYIFVFEGMMNMLSHVQIYGKIENAMYIIMNSTSNVKKTINHIWYEEDTAIEQPTIELWLDNGTSGDVATIKIMEAVKATDKRNTYRQFDDVNDLITNTKKQKREYRIIKKEKYRVYRNGILLHNANSLTDVNKFIGNSKINML